MEAIFSASSRQGTTGKMEIAEAVVNETAPAAYTAAVDGHHARAAWPLQIYARDEDTKIRFISDRAPVLDGRLFDIAFFESEEEAAAIALACASLLGSKPDMSADDSGWHRLPTGAPVGRFLPNLLQAARNTVWTGAMPSVEGDPPSDDDEASHEPPELHRTTTRNRRASRTWPREKDYVLVEMIVTGHSAKAIAADPRMIGTSVDAVYKRASRLGYSFIEAQQVGFSLPLAHLQVFDRAAAAVGMTRNAFMRVWAMKAAANPARFELIMIGR